LISPVFWFIWNDPHVKAQSRRTLHSKHASVQWKYLQYIARILFF